MIVTEFLLRNIINQMPRVLYNTVYRDINFGWGDKLELNKYLALMADDSYPLIWLMSPSSETYLSNSMLVERDCSFIIATLEDRTDLFNPQRYEEGSFDKILNPISKRLAEGVRSSSGTRFLNDDTFIINKFPNYSEKSKSKENASIELWDAIRFDCRIEFNKSCLNKIRWRTR